MGAIGTPGGTQAQQAVHPAEVQKAAPLRHGTSGNTRAGSLDGHQGPLAGECFEGLPELLFRGGKGNAPGLSGEARLVAQVLHVLRLDGTDEGWSGLIPRVVTGRFYHSVRES